jgi:hypothetical protein
MRCTPHSITWCRFRDRGRITWNGWAVSTAGCLPRRSPWLFDLDLDPNESYDVSDRHPETFRRLGYMLEARLLELERNPRGWL